MNIVVLDGYTLNPGDLSWDEMTALGSITVYERTAPDEIVGRAAGADAVLTNKTPITAETIQQLPGLKYIGVLATGYNIVNTEAAAERGIIVTNVPDYSTFSVVQLVFAFLLERCHHVGEHSAAVHNGRWSAGPDFMFSLHPLLELAGKTIGIIGFGQIGQQVAKAALAFGMDVAVHTRTAKQIPGLEGVRFLTADAVFEQSDIISLHCPLTPDTAGIINSRSLQLMKKEAFLINTARGGHLVEQDLANALNEGVIAGAALNVLTVEPPRADHPLLHARNCIITPHIGWATIDARRRLMSIATANLRSFQQNHIVNKVN